MLGRYEYKDGKSNKYWEVILNGNTWHFFWGRIGAKPQMTSTIDATKVEKKIREKLGKGYEYKGEARSYHQLIPSTTVCHCSDNIFGTTLGQDFVEDMAERHEENSFLEALKKA